jgi:hypothetical protein
MNFALIVRAAIEKHGVTLPLSGPINAKAVFYRDADRGDLTGFLAALGDVIQAPRIKDGKTLRKGMGIIVDDAQIVSWDGSRLAKDPARPRIEVTVTAVSPRLWDETPAAR